MKLGEIRADLAAIVMTATPDTVAVYDHPPDQIAVPAVLIGWADPWLIPDTMIHWSVGAELLIVAGRMDVAGQLETLEDTLSDVVAGLEPTVYEVAGAGAPFAVQIAGVNYLAATVTVHRNN